jgi:hypothetical protein
VAHFHIGNLLIMYLWFLERSLLSKS